MRKNLFVVHAVLVAACVTVSLAGAGRAEEKLIPVEDIDNWYCEYFAGGGLRDGARREEGAGLGTTAMFGVGFVAVDDYGNVYQVNDASVWVITSDGIVHLLAGIADLPGTADGPADRACLKAPIALTVNRTNSTVYVSDAGVAVRKIARGPDGSWTVTTLAGRAGASGHKDGPGSEALLQHVDGLALDSRGNLYMADQDWLRRLSPDGELVTLNPKGGSGPFGPGTECPLESLKLNRIMGAGPLACDENDNVLLADKWNGTFLRVDVAAGKVTVLAGAPTRGQPGFRDGSTPVDGPGNSVARFHAGGGPTAVAYDRLTKRLYTSTADECAVRAITPDGMVRTLGPGSPTNNKNLQPGPLRATKGIGLIAGVDAQGRVYAGYRPGPLYRFYRKPEIAGAPAVKTPNPLLPWPPAKAAKPDDTPVALQLPAANAATLAAGPAARLPGASGTAALPVSIQARIGEKEHALSLRQTSCSAGGTTVAVRDEVVREEGQPPVRRVLAAVRSEDGKVRVEGVEIDPRGRDPLVVFDGAQFVVVYQGDSLIQARRVTPDGKLTDAKPLAIGDQWAGSAAVAANGEVVAVAGCVRPSWNPWGWGGPGAVCVGRLTRDGHSPERAGGNPNTLADGGYAGLLDSAKWKGKKGWPAGARGGFKGTENGYWPSAGTAVCWDGKTWVAAWVRTRIADGDKEIFASRVDPATMMPIGEPALVAGGEAEPGGQARPALIGIGDGTSALVYLAVQPDGQIVPSARLLAGGAIAGPARVDPPRAK
jgi:hypothetical protein